MSGKLSISFCLTWLQVVATALNGWASSIPSFLAILYRVELGILYTLEALLAEISFFLRASSALKKKHVNQYCLWCLATATTHSCRSSSVHDLEDVSFFGVGIPILFALCHSVVGGMP